MLGEYQPWLHHTYSVVFGKNVVDLFDVLFRNTFQDEAAVLRLVVGNV